MTDATLAALLADPDPAARLIAADLIEEAGGGLQAAAMRVLAYRDPDSDAPDGLFTLGRRWTVMVHPSRKHPLGLITVQGFASGESVLGSPDRWEYDCQEGVWRFSLPENHWRLALGTPPPGLEDAVLAVLRGRLEEVRPSL